jgi:hypothetical protein
VRMLSGLGVDKLITARAIESERSILSFGSLHEGMRDVLRR